MQIQEHLLALIPSLWLRPIFVSSAQRRCSAAGKATGGDVGALWLHMQGLRTRSWLMVLAVAAGDPNSSLRMNGAGDADARPDRPGRESVQLSVCERQRRKPGLAREEAANIS